MSSSGSNRHDSPDREPLDVQKEGSGQSVKRDSEFHQQSHTEQVVRLKERLLDSVGEAVIALDVNGRVIYWNQAAESLYGWSAEEAMGRTLREMVVPQYSREYAQQIMDQVKGGKSWSGEFTVQRRDSTFLSVMATNTPLHDEQGNLTGVVGVISDFTERKRTEEALEESERRHATLLSNAPALVYRCRNDRSWPMEFASDYALELTGYSKEELVEGDGVEYGDLLVEDDRERVWQEVQQSLSERTRFKLRYSIRRRDGILRHVEEYGQGLYEEDESVKVIEGLIYDVTGFVKAREDLLEAEERYRTLVESIPAVTYIDSADNSDTPLYTSPQVEGLLGYTPEEWMTERLWHERLHPDDRARVLAADERFEAGDEYFSEEYRLIARGGRVVWVHEEATLLKSSSGKPLFWQGVLYDITERKGWEEALLEAEEHFRGTFEEAPIGVALVALPSNTPEEDRRYLKVNPALCEMLGYTEGELVSMTSSDVTYSDDLLESRRRVDQMMANGEPKYTLEKRYVRSDGEIVWALLNVSLVRDSEGNPSHLVSQFQDVTGRKVLEEELKYRSFHDLLTGIPNRQLLNDRLQLAMERTQRTEARKVAVLFMDLDGFKLINDSLGHEIGDALLVQISKRLKQCIRPTDTLARFGGDEFVVLVEDIADADDAVRVAERITEELRRPLVVEGRELFARASIGISLGGGSSWSSRDLLRDADTAMYRAKEIGGGYRIFDHAMHESVIARLEKENDLHRAIEAEEFVVHYQPILRLQSTEVWGVEALVRWDHPERGVIGPSEFVPQTEKSGLIIPMGEQVLEKACRQARSWQKENPSSSPLTVCVNLSAAQLQRPEVTVNVERVLLQTGLEGRFLSLDITETIYIKELEGHTAALNRLRDLGVRISIDDFGTGYSSLAYLKRIPADALKIDKTFIKRLGEDIEDTAIVDTIIDLAHTVGMEVIAEGIESKEQADQLVEMGCDLGQGYYFSHPLTSEYMSDFLQR